MPTPRKCVGEAPWISDKKSKTLEVWNTQVSAV